LYFQKFYPLGRHAIRPQTHVDDGINYRLRRDAVGSNVRAAFDLGTNTIPVHHTGAVQEILTSCRHPIGRPSLEAFLFKKNYFKFKIKILKILKLNPTTYDS
jgi:hypothetical protein